MPTVSYYDEINFSGDTSSPDTIDVVRDGRRLGVILLKSDQGCFCPINEQMDLLSPTALRAIADKIEEAMSRRRAAAPWLK